MDEYEKHAHAVSAASAGTASSVENLARFIDLKQSQALNCVGASIDTVMGARDVLSAGEVAVHRSQMVSDASTDSEQMIFVIAFNEAVRIDAISIQAAAGDGDASAPPNAVRLFVQQPNYSFDECEFAKPTFECLLTEKQVAYGTQIKLPLARFGCVNSLTLFFPGNFAGGNARTCIGAVQLFGVPRSGTNMSNLRSQACGC